MTRAQIMAQEKSITDYEVMFTMHTGVTVLVEKLKEFDKINGEGLHFRISPDQSLKIETPEALIVIKNLNSDYLEEALERGFIMFYELEDDEVVRCTPCQIHRQQARAKP